MKKSASRSITLSIVAASLLVLAACGPKTTEEHIEQARQYLSENDSAAAIVALKNAVQANPKSAEARFELGSVYMQTRQFESAEKELNRALENGYDAAKVLPLLTQAYQQTGAYSALSKIEVEQAGLTSSERAEIGYFKVLSLVRLEKITESRQLIEALSDLDTNSVYKGLTAAYTAVLDKDFAKAESQVAALREYAPQDAEVLKLLAQIELALNKPQDAAEVFKDYVKFYPDDMQISFVLAKLLVDIGKPDEAEPLVDKLLKINQQHPLLNQLKAVAAAARKDFADSLKYAETAITNGANDPSLRLIAGYAAYQLADYASANRHFSFIASLLPDNHPALRLLAASQLQLGLTNDAADVLGRIDELTSDDAPLLSKASYELLREGNVNDARQLVEKSTNISVTAEDLTRLGLLQLSLNNVEGIVNLEEAVEKAPQLDSAQSTLATAYVATGQYDKAMELANKWLAAHPDNNKAYLLKSQIHAKQQKYDLAYADVEAAIKVDPADPVAQMASINLDLLQNKFAPAQQKLDSFLQKNPTYVSGLATNYLLLKKNGQVEKGVEQAKNALKSAPDNVELRLLMARIYLAEQQTNEALTILEAIKDPAKAPRSYWKIKGQTLIVSNQRRAAEAHYDAWLALYPYDKDATLGRALLFDSENKFADGVKLTNTFLDNRSDVQIQILHLHFLVMSADFTAARQAYDKLPANSLSLPLVKGLLARLQAHDKLYQEALANAQVAYQAAQSNRNVILITFLLEKLQRQQDAKTFLAQHISNHPEDMASRMLLAERQIDGDSSDAMKSYEIAIQKNPQNYVALNNLAYLNLQQGQLKKAKQYAQKAVELKPNEPATLDTLAQVLVAEKDYDAALKYYEQAVNTPSKSEEIYLNYIETLFAAKQDFLAKRKLEQMEWKEEASLKRIAALKQKFSF